MVCGNIFKALSISNHKSWRAEYFERMFTPHHVSHITCHMSGVSVRCHLSFLTKWWSLSGEGPLSTGPTQSILYLYIHTVWTNCRSPDFPWPPCPTKEVWKALYSCGWLVDHTQRFPDKNEHLCLDCLWPVSGLSLDCLWTVSGLSLDCLLTVSGLQG